MSKAREIALERLLEACVPLLTQHFGRRLGRNEHCPACTVQCKGDPYSGPFVHAPDCAGCKLLRDVQALLAEDGVDDHYCNSPTCPTHGSVGAIPWGRRL